MTIETLVAKGWKMYYSCHCGGSLKQYFKNKKYPGWHIIIRPSKKTATILKNNHIKASSIWLYQLDTKMTDYAIIN